MIPILILIVLIVLGAIEHVWLAAAFWASWYGVRFAGSYVAAHPWQAIGYGAGYFLVGAVWSIVKWWRHEVARVESVRSEFDHHDKFRKPDDTWTEYIRHRKSNVADYKGIITAWITFWPFSAVWTLLDDPIRRLCARIYKELYGVYQRISDKVWA